MATDGEGTCIPKGVATTKVRLDRQTGEAGTYHQGKEGYHAIQCRLQVLFKLDPTTDEAKNEQRMEGQLLWSNSRKGNNSSTVKSLFHEAANQTS